MVDLRQAYLGNFFDEYTATDFYRMIFSNGELQEKGKYNDKKYNAIAVELIPDGDKTITKRYTITDDLEMIKELEKHNNFIIISPISYVGKSRKAENARYIYAMAIDLDGVCENDHMIDLFNQIQEVDYLPRPTSIVSSGNGLHLYYVFKKPIPCFKNITDKMAKLKHALTKKIWNGYVTKESENVQYQSLFQGFRMVGGITKNGNRTRAYETGSKVTLDYLNQYVDEKYRVNDYVYKSELTKAQAKEKYPEWYEKRIVEKKPKGSWQCNRALYDWWKNKIEKEIVEGHRYYGIMCLAVYAKKCGIAEQELEQDAINLTSQLDRLTKNENNHFTNEDTMAALEMYNDNYITFPIESISSLTNVRIDRNKRNGRKLEQHIKMVNAMRIMKRDVLGENEYKNNGRPKAEPIIKAYMEKHPQDTKADVIRGTGLAKHTVYKYYDDIKQRCTKVVQSSCFGKDKA